MSWLQDYRCDVDHYRRFNPATPALRLVAGQQGLWALLQYRIARAAYGAALPSAVKKPLLAGMSVWRKAIEVSTGISIPKEAEIGPGLSINHMGNVGINDKARIGRDCTLGQGVTIGLSWGKGRYGVPVIGDNVWIGANAVVAGKITIGDGAAISANSLVLRDVPAHAFARGVPAEIKLPREDDTGADVPE